MDFATTLQSPGFQAVILILVLGVLIFVAVYSYMSWNEYDTLIKNADSTTDETTLARWKRNKGMEMAGFIIVIILSAIVLAMIIFLFSRTSAYRTMKEYYDQGVTSASAWARTQRERFMAQTGQVSPDQLTTCAEMLRSKINCPGLEQYLNQPRPGLASNALAVGMNVPSGAPLGVAPPV